MTLQNLKATLLAEARKLRTAVNIALLAALPWAGEIKAAVATNLPSLQPYLPENIYKFMGAGVVITGMVLSIVATHRAVKASDESRNA